MSLYGYGTSRTTSTPQAVTLSTGVTINGFSEALDKISTFLADGSLWHKRLANQCRKISIRGLGRWHEVEGKGDYCLAKKLEKIVGDKLGYYPNVDTTMFEESVKVALTNLSDFKEHFVMWKKREEELINVLNYAISEARNVDIEVYEELCCIIKEVQNEKMRITMAYNRLELAGWNGHDIGVVSMKLHKYFEFDYKTGEPIDFNIG